MVARSEVKLEVGEVFVNIKTGELYTIIVKHRAIATRNSGGFTTKKSHSYILQNNKTGKKIGSLNRGNLLNSFRPLETITEQILYGIK